MAWLVLPQFRGAAFIYERYVREQMKKYGILRDHHHHHSGSPDGKGKKKFVQFIVPKKVCLSYLILTQTIMYILVSSIVKEFVDMDDRGSRKLTEEKGGL